MVEQGHDLTIQIVPNTVYVTAALMSVTPALTPVQVPLVVKGNPCFRIVVVVGRSEETKVKSTCRMQPIKPISGRVLRASIDTDHRCDFLYICLKEGSVYNRTSITLVAVSSRA